jgi:hypothetical protein
LIVDRDMVFQRAEAKPINMSASPFEAETFIEMIGGNPVRA